MKYSRFRALAALTACLSLAHAAAALDLDLYPVASGMANPVFVTQAPGDDTRLYIVERYGNIRIVKDGVLLPVPFLELGDEVNHTGGEQGLLGLAFAPDYATSGNFYIDYTATKVGATQPPTRICRLQRDQNNPDRAVALSSVLLLEIAQPYANHNGGMIAFGPDGYLYIGMGDGGSGNDPDHNAQNLNALLGKILRIDVTEGGEGAGTGGAFYDIPPTNPFAAGGGAPEIWSYGMRNPWRFSFDSANGDLWIGDVGQNAFEEIDYQAAGAPGGRNYGWAVFEAARCNTNYNGTRQPDCDALAPDVTFPIYSFVNPTIGNAVVGGYVYHGAAFPELQGLYFFSDAGKGFIKTLKFVSGNPVEIGDLTADITSRQSLGEVVSFGQDNLGELYICDLNGTVYKLVNAVHHNADENGDFKISLSEVLRVIQFFNSLGYHCEAGTEDGYAPGPGGDQTCTPHDSDYQVLDWKLSLSELLRTIQFYNADGFYVCEGGEDGFCPLFFNK